MGLNELRTLDRWSLEDRARALCQPIYLGGDLMLCRVLGRYKLYVPTTDVGFGVHVLMEGIWEGWLTVFLTRLIKPGMTVLDVGANHGYYTVLLADLVGEEGAVVAVEPHPRTASLLRQTIYVNGFSQRTDIIEAAAVASASQALSLHVPIAEPKNAHLVSSDRFEEPDVVSVAALTLDSLIDRFPRVDFMKIDVEGAEEDAVAGAMQIVKRDKPDIILEFNVHRCRDAPAFLASLLAVYGTLRALDYDGTTPDISTDKLLDRGRTDDWLLYLTVR